MSEYGVRIEVLENGYEVEICDPDIQAANRDPKKPWQEPWKGYACMSVDEVLALLKKKLPTLSASDEEGGEDEFAVNFERASNEGE